jgi:hypothetical protein
MKYRQIQTIRPSPIARCILALLPLVARRMRIPVMLAPQPPPVRIPPPATPEDAQALALDEWLFGMSVRDERGVRVDPSTVRLMRARC